MEDDIMKISVEREVDVDLTLRNLNKYSQCKDPGQAGYTVSVDKQLLRDAHDIIFSLYQREMLINVADGTYGKKKPSCFGSYGSQQYPKCGGWCPWSKKCESNTSGETDEDEF
jgi:hypothetical protein